MVFTKEDILSHLAALSHELEKREIHGEIFLVGGAAMALAYNRHRTTKDLDEVFEPKAIIYEAAQIVAQQRGLKPNWLNDAVKGYFPSADTQAKTYLCLPALSVAVASPRYLFALKAFASRIDRDIDDIKELYRLCGFTSVDEAIDYVAKAYRGRPIAARVAYVLRETLEPSQENNPHDVLDDLTKGRPQSAGDHLDDIK